MNRQKHLEFNQAVIARLSDHSFKLKTFGLIQVGAIAAFVASRDTGVGALCLLAPAAAFMLWYLDARFPRDERAYRVLYEAVRQTVEEVVDFRMMASSLLVVPAGNGDGSTVPGASGQ